MSAVVIQAKKKKISGKTNMKNDMKKFSQVPFQKTVPKVCCLYVQVENFTVAFSDGRVLCYLIHHYHPSLLPGEAVSHSTTQTVECSLRGRVELNCSTSDSDNSFDSFPTGLNGTWQLFAVSSFQF